MSTGTVTSMDIEQALDKWGQLKDKDKPTAKDEIFCGIVECHCFNHFSKVVKALEKALEHLDYCGWGDRWERECSAELRQELPNVLAEAKRVIM
jgi:hypothetical protein